MKFGHSRVRVYRLETEFLGNEFTSSPAALGKFCGWMRRNKITLRNEAFSHF